MKLAIVGSRGYPKLELVADLVKSLPKDTEIVSGGARGVDSVAEAHARCHGLKVTVFIPDWDGQGKSAGFIRNRKIINASDEVVAFWDGTSRGTMHSINLAREAHKKVTVIGPDGMVMPCA